MNTQNAEFLKERLFFLGFGDKLSGELFKNIKADKDQFQLAINAEFSKGDKKDLVDYKLDFSKSKQGDMYFINKYEATLKGETPDKDKTQTFYLNKGSGITAKEAYNMLDGRAVHKKLIDREDNPYQAWLQINFKEKDDHGNHKLDRYHPAYGFDLDKSLSRHPIKELATPEENAALKKSLEKGNIQSVTFLKEGKEEKMFLEANPRERSLNVYNAQMVKQFHGIKERKGVASGQEHGEKPKSAKDEKVEEAEGERKGKGRWMSV
ncbi:MAG TPA: hypothetical protein VIU12_25765 [Chryseolinea sp.]